MISLGGLGRICENLRNCTAKLARHSSTRIQLSDDTKPRIIFSGIQPTGTPHLGNYLGTLRHWAYLTRNLKRGDEAFFSIVGLHALSKPQDPASLRESRSDMAAMLISLGLDTQQSSIFLQEDVPEHSELSWILMCQARVARLMRMTTWKSNIMSDGEGSGLYNINSRSSPLEDLSLGLLGYPVLQAADVLLYGTTHVPVGEDQVQHIELTRHLAKSFNHNYRNVFTMPETVLSAAPRIYSLQNPSAKMCKSDPLPRSRLQLTDPESVSRKSIMSAVTDGENNLVFSASQPGLANLFSILAAMKCNEDEYSTMSREKLSMKAESLAATYDSSASYATLKSDVAQSFEETVASIRDRYLEVRRDERQITEVLNKGRDRARTVASAKLELVKDVLGIGRLRI